MKLANLPRRLPRRPAGGRVARPEARHAMPTASRRACNRAVPATRSRSTPSKCLAPLPRLSAWIAGDAYPDHGRALRERGIAWPERLSGPLLRAGGAEALLGPADTPALRGMPGLEPEAQLAVLTADLPQGAVPSQALEAVRLLMLVNDWVLRPVQQEELAGGLPAMHSRPALQFAPVAVTPDELTGAWYLGRAALQLQLMRNGRKQAVLDAKAGMQWSFGDLLAEAARNRPLRAGTLVGAGMPGGGKPVSLEAGDSLRIDESDAASGVRAALERGAQAALTNLGRTDGFLGNPQVRIELPGALKDAARLLRTTGQGKRIDDLITSMNRAAEQAMPEARQLLVNTVRNISVEDALKIVRGGRRRGDAFLRGQDPQPAEHEVPAHRDQGDRAPVAEREVQRGGRQGGGLRPGPQGGRESAVLRHRQGAGRARADAASIAAVAPADDAPWRDRAHDLATLDTLRGVYAAPTAPATLDKECDHVHPLYRPFIEASPFAILATRGSNGLDTSPRGDGPGFVEIADPKTLLLPDRRGNHRIDSLRNVLHDPAVALLFLIPGIGECLRVNGQARISAAPALLERFAVEGQLPKSVLVIEAHERPTASRPAIRYTRGAALPGILASRIAVLDGAMGTMIQRYKLTEEDFRGARFADHPKDLKGNNDLLVLTKPEVIAEIHRQYLEAGADVIETNTFGTTSVAQEDYGLEEHAYEMNVAAARLAREACDQYSTPDKPRFVAGALGPTPAHRVHQPGRQRPRRPQRRFRHAARRVLRAGQRLARGRRDLFLIETIFDTLNAKAAIFALDELMEDTGARLPVMISGTITDASGRTLSGQTVTAFWHSVRHARPWPSG
ncbi:homocysteine s-methyltransferase domain-containing protein [Ditylenchus destructor]|nr:homocysteine s-methyltransferase domain-containing protein [Ditylenchus destructor]